MSSKTLGTLAIVFGVIALILGVITLVANAAELTKPIKLAWDQDAKDFIIPAGQTKPALSNWIVYQRNTPGGSTAVIYNVPYEPAKLSGVTNPDGTRTYNWGPYDITVAGSGGSTVKRCWVVVAVGNDIPPTTTGPSNEVCQDFVMPADPIPPPGTPSHLVVKP